VALEARRRQTCAGNDARNHGKDTLDQSLVPPSSGRLYAGFLRLNLPPAIPSGTAKAHP